MESSKQKRF